MTFDLLIKNATILDPSRDIYEKKDIKFAGTKFNNLRIKVNI